MIQRRTPIRWSEYDDELRDFIVQVLERVRHARGNVDDVGALLDKYLVTQCVEDLLPLQQHVGFLALVGVHRGSSAGCRVGDPDGQVLIAVPLSLHDVDVLTWPRVDHVQVTLGEGEVLDVGHRGRLERPGHSSSFQDLVRMVLGIQLPPCFIDVEDQLAVLDPLTRLCVEGEDSRQGRRPRSRFALASKGVAPCRETPRVPARDERDDDSLTLPPMPAPTTGRS